MNKYQKELCGVCILWGVVSDGSVVADRPLRASQKSGAPGRKEKDSLEAAVDCARRLVDGTDNDDIL